MKSITMYFVLLCVFGLFSCSDSSTGVTNGDILFYRPIKVNDYIPYSFELFETDSQIYGYGFIELNDSMKNEIDIVEPKRWDMCDPAHTVSDSIITNFIKIFVDTTKSISINKYLDGNNPVPFQALPCYIVNFSGDTIDMLTQDYCIPMIQEALDSDGIWKPVEFWWNSWCGNSYYYVYLAPKHFLMTRIIKYDGNFATKLRIKARITFPGNKERTIYSNEFNGKINKNQFIRKDDDGLISYFED